MYFLLILVASLSMFACSDSSFQANNPTAKKEVASTDESPSTNTDIENSNDTSGSDESSPLPGADDYDVNNSDQVDNRSDSADRNEVDFETFGCRFPANVRNIADGMGLASFSLGWRDTSPPQVGEVELKNLMVSECEWFKDGEADGFMLVYSEGKQSYAEPFNGGMALLLRKSNSSNSGNPCQSAARSLSASLSQQGIEGVVECSTLPK